MNPESQPKDCREDMLYTIHRSLYHRSFPFRERFWESDLQMGVCHCGAKKLVNHKEEIFFCDCPFPED